MSDGLKIESVQHPWVKKAVSLHQAKYRREEQLILVEGPHPVQEALKAGLCCEKLFILPEKPQLDWSEYPLPPLEPSQPVMQEVSEGVMRKISTTDTPPPCAGVFRLPQTLPKWLQNSSEREPLPLWVVLDRLQDPGNVGSVIRSALAFGATQVITTSESVDVYSPKVIRASTGLVFALPVWQSGLDLLTMHETVLSKHLSTVFCGIGYPGVASYREANYQHACALVLGQEGKGVLPAFLDKVGVDAQVLGIRIPMTEQVESLNVGVSAAIILAEASAQRGLPIAAQAKAMQAGRNAS